MKLLFAFFLSVAGFHAKCDALLPVEKNSTEIANERATQLVGRLNEIHSMDRSTLSRTERKELRHEVHAIKKELAGISGGVYLSVGAIIIIILLLILLL